MEYEEDSLRVKLKRQGRTPAGRLCLLAEAGLAYKS